MGTERDILYWQNQYNTAMNWARLKPAGSREQAQEYYKAARAQHELMDLTEGTVSERHRAECNELTDMAYRIIDPEPKPRTQQAAAQDPGKAAGKPAPAPQEKPRPRREHREPTPLYTVDQLKGLNVANFRYDDPDTMKASFDTMNGDEKQMILDHFNRIHAMEKYRRLREKAAETNALEQSLNLFLYGPPGTGKSTYISAMCRYILENEEDSVAFILEPDNYRADLQGIAEKVIKEVFHEARQYRNAIICVDEIVGLCPKDKGHGDRGVDTLNMFLNEIDGVRKHDGNVIVVGATNYPWRVDPAAVSRLPNRVYIGLPSEEDMVKFLLEHARPFLGASEKEQEEMARFIAGRLEHGSYRELKQVAAALNNRAFLKTIRLNPDNYDVDTFAPLTREEIEREILSGIVILYSPELMEAYSHPERW